MSASGAGPRDGAQERADARVRAAQVEDLLDHRAVLALERADVLVVGLGVLVDGHLDAQRAGGVGVRGAGDAPRHALDHDGGAAAGNAHALDDVGDGADARELAIRARDEQHALLLPGLDGQGGGHAREKDRVVEGDENQVFHWCLFQFR